MSIDMNSISGNERILIVDDEKDMLNSLKMHFSLEGIEADICDNPFDALKMVEDNGYNIVLTDIRMPGMDGVQLLKTIKEMNPLCNVIIITAYSNMTYLVECFAAGACDYFSKPINDMNILIDSVKCAIERVTRWRKGMGFHKFI